MISHFVRILSGGGKMTINKFCKIFRENILNLTLAELSKRSEKNLKTISAFENERSNNLNHIQIYFSACENELDRITFMKNLEVVLRGGSNG